MKKVLCLLLALVMTFSLCACKKSKKKMLEQIDYSDVFSVIYDIDSNVVRATEKYEGKILRIDHLTVQSILPSDDYVSVQQVYRLSDGFTVTAKLSKEDALTINANDRINIVGVLSNISSTGVILDNAFIINE